MQLKAALHHQLARDLNQPASAIRTVEQLDGKGSQDKPRALAFANIGMVLAQTLPF
jgi:hypothetical protein